MSEKTYIRGREVSTKEYCDNFKDCALYASLDRKTYKLSHHSSNVIGDLNADADSFPILFEAKKKEIGSTRLQLISILDEA